MYTEYYIITYKPKRLAKKENRKPRHRATHKTDCFYGLCILVVLALTLVAYNMLESATNKAIAATDPTPQPTSYVVPVSQRNSRYIATPLANITSINITPVKIPDPVVPMAEEPAPSVEEVVEVSDTNYAECIAMPPTHQDFVLDNAALYNIPEELGFAIIWRESTYRSDVYSSTNDAGYMQINACNYNGLEQRIGFDPANPCDPAMNIQGGFYLLREMINMYNPDSWHSLLMIYNMGYTTAKGLWEQGIYSSQYSRAVISYCEENFGALSDISSYK